MAYAQNENRYQIIEHDPDAIVWKEFAIDKARLEFDDYCCIVNLHLIRGSQEHIFLTEPF